MNKQKCRNDNVFGGSIFVENDVDDMRANDTCRDCISEGQCSRLQLLDTDKTPQYISYC